MRIQVCQNSVLSHTKILRFCYSFIPVHEIKLTPIVMLLKPFTLPLSLFSCLCIYYSIESINMMERICLFYYSTIFPLYNFLFFYIMSRVIKFNEPIWFQICNFYQKVIYHYHFTIILLLVIKTETAHHLICMLCNC